MTFKRSYKIPIYGGRLNIILCDSLKEAQQELGIDFGAFGKNLDDYDGGCFQTGHNHYVVLQHDPTPGLMAHECKHFINHVFIDNGVELDRYNDEHECYFLGWAVNRVQEVLNKYKKRK